MKWHLKGCPTPQKNSMKMGTYYHNSRVSQNHRVEIEGTTPNLKFLGLPFQTYTHWEYKIKGNIIALDFTFAEFLSNIRQLLTFLFPKKPNILLNKIHSVNHLFSTTFSGWGFHMDFGTFRIFWFPPSQVIETRYLMEKKFIWYLANWLLTVTWMSRLKRSQRHPSSYFF